MGLFQCPPKREGTFFVTFTLGEVTFARKIKRNFSFLFDFYSLFRNFAATN